MKNLKQFSSRVTLNKDEWEKLQSLKGNKAKGQFISQVKKSQRV